MKIKKIQNLLKKTNISLRRIKESYGINEKCALYLIMYVFYYLQYGTFINAAEYQALTGEDLSAECLVLMEKSIKKIKEELKKINGRLLKIAKREAIFYKILRISIIRALIITKNKLSKH